MTAQKSLVLLSLALVACATASSTPEAIEGPVASGEEFLATCSDKGHVVLGSACTNIEEEGGVWRATPVFMGACTYQWESTAPAPTSFHVSDASLVAETCLDRPPPFVPAKPLGLDAHSGEGVNHCDVCLVLKDRKVFVVLPPEKRLKGVINLKTKEGALPPIGFDRPNGANAVIVELPPDVDETQLDIDGTYVE